MLLKSYSQSHCNKTDQSVFTKQIYFIQLWSNSSLESDDDFHLDYQRFINRNGSKSFLDYLYALSRTITLHKWMSLLGLKYVLNLKKKKKKVRSLKRLIQGTCYMINKANFPVTTVDRNQSYCWLERYFTDHILRSMFTEQLISQLTLLTL